MKALTQRLRRLREDERGITPTLAISSIVLYGIVSFSIVAVIVAALQLSSILRINGGLADATNDSVRSTAALGYEAARLLPATSTVHIALGDADVEAKRDVVVNEATKTARVTITAPRYAVLGFRTLADCQADVKSCFQFSEIVTGHVLPGGGS